MFTARRDGSPPTLVSLEAAAASARGGFACLFSSSDEYETALVAERRAQGRYGSSRNYLPKLLFAVCALMVVGAVALLA